MNRQDNEKQISLDFKETFATEHGERVLKKLRSLTTFSRSSINSVKEIDVNRLVYDEGQRAVILYIDKQINKDLSKARS